MDGGKEIIIEQNQSYENDLRIEVASEHAGKSASQITVRDNTISNNIMNGIALGGYDSQQGYAENNTITNNIIYKNDTRDQESGQIELNYDTRNNVITNNHIYASNSRIFISNNFNKTPETNLITIITMVISVKVMVCGNGKEKRIKDFQLIKQV